MYLDIFGLVFEVYPGVGVAPHEDGEEEGADHGRHQHHEQPEQPVPARGVQGVVVESGNTNTLMELVTLDITDILTITDLNRDSHLRLSLRSPMRVTVLSASSFSLERKGSSWCSR